MNEETKAKDVSEETVTLKKADLDELMKRLQRVEYAADKAHLATFDDRNREARTKVVRVRTYEGKVVLYWDDLSTNIVEKNSNGSWYEDQVATLHFSDGTQKELPYVTFVKYYVGIPAEVIAETKTGNQMIYKVRMVEGGQEFEINEKFVN